MTEAAQSTPNHCHAITNAGHPCNSVALPGRNYCYQHEPSVADERAEARRRGGHGRATTVRLQKLMPPRLTRVYDRLESALERVESGELDPRQAQAMASLARAMVAVLTGGELEQRVRDLEQRTGKERFRDEPRAAD